MKTKKHIFCEIAKAEKQDDGTLIVEGYASTTQQDSDGETITADAMKAALPDYMAWGAVREMHQPLAAGTALEAQVEDDGRTAFKAHIVDPVAVLKCETGVYKGFSIGGKVTARDDADKKVIKGLKLVEVSLVDRPANPGATFKLFKADGIDDGETIEKGLWTVQDFAGLLASLGWICRDAQYDADYEGDNSPVPAALRGWLAQGIAIFRDMAAEELAELLADLKREAGEVDVIEMAAKGAKADDLHKAGARFSKATKEALGAIHKAARDACDHLDKLGYAGDDEEGEGDGADKAAASEAMQKAAGLADDLAKVTGELDAAKADLAKLTGEADTLRKRVSELEAMPAPPKGALRTVEKAADLGSPDAPAVEPVRKSDGTTDETATLIKAAFARPIRIGA